MGYIYWYLLYDKFCKYLLIHLKIVIINPININITTNHTSIVHYDGYKFSDFGLKYPHLWLTNIINCFSWSEILIFYYNYLNWRSVKKGVSSSSQLRQFHKCFSLKHHHILICSGSVLDVFPILSQRILKRNTFKVW